MQIFNCGIRIVDGAYAACSKKVNDWFALKA